MILNSKMSWLSAAGLGALLVAGSAVPGMSQGASGLYGAGDRRLEGQRFTTMRALAHRLDEAAQQAARTAGDTAQPRNGRMRQRFLSAVNDFARQARSFHERLDQYGNSPWDVADEVAALNQRARQVSAQIRAANAFRETYEDWTQAEEALNLMNRLLRGENVSIPAQGTRTYQPFDEHYRYSDGGHLEGFGDSAVPAPYDQRDARPRDLVALQDDLRLLDDSMSALQTRDPRYQEFQRRAEVIRRDVSVLADGIRQRGQAGGQGYGGGRREVIALRLNIAALRSDVENTQSSRVGQGYGAFLIPAGTEMQVMLNQDLSSRSANLEDRIEASTVTALQLNGRTVIPAGATVSGFVSEVRSKNRGQQDDWLKLDFNSLAVEGGPRTNIRSRVVSVSAERSGNHTLRNGGIGALLGGVLGGIIDGKKGALIGAAVGAGGGILASQGKDDVELPEGTLITLRLDGPINVARR